MWIVQFFPMKNFQKWPSYLSRTSQWSPRGLLGAAPLPPLRRRADLFSSNCTFPSRGGWGRGTQTIGNRCKCSKKALRVFESHQSWHLLCGQIPNGKQQPPFEPELRGQAGVCALPGAAPHWAAGTAPPSSDRDLPTPDITRAPWNGSVPTLCTKKKKSCNGNMRSTCRRITYSKSTIWFGSALSGSFQTNSACVPKRSQPIKITFFQVHASLATIYS